MFRCYTATGIADRRDDFIGIGLTNANINSSLTLRQTLDRIQQEIGKNFLQQLRITCNNWWGILRGEFRGDLYACALVNFKVVKSLVDNFRNVDRLLF